MFIPGRLELLSRRPSIILDGAHNEDGIRVLVDYLREENIGAFTLIFGVLGDKHYPAMARQLAPLAAHVILTAPPGARALAPEKLLPFFKQANWAPGLWRRKNCCLFSSNQIAGSKLIFPRPWLLQKN